MNDLSQTFHIMKNSTVLPVCIQIKIGVWEQIDESDQIIFVQSCSVAPSSHLKN